MKNQIDWKSTWASRWCIYILLYHIRKKNNSTTFLRKTTGYEPESEPLGCRFYSLRDNPIHLELYLPALRNSKICQLQSSDQTVAAIEPLTGSENYATWKR